MFTVAQRLSEPPVPGKDQVANVRFVPILLQKSAVMDSW